MGIKQLIFYSIFHFLMLSYGMAQSTADSLHIVFMDDVSVYDLETPQTKVSDLSEGEAVLSQWIIYAQFSSYLEASLDSITVDADSIKAHVYLGPSYEWVRFEVGDLDQELLKHLRYVNLDLEDEKFNYQSLVQVYEEIIGFYEERGYPFVEVKLEGLTIEEGEVSARMVVNPNRYIRIKEVVNAGDAVISENYLSRYLGMRPGSAFQKTKITEKAPQRLNQLPFAAQRRSPLIQFVEDEAIVNVFLNKRNASRFDFVLGVLPNSAETGQLLFTGTANMELQNTLGAGERLYFQFQRLRPETQELVLEVNYPYLPDLPFGVNGLFNLYTRDSTNRDIRFNVGVLYMLEGGDYVRGFWNQFNSDVLSVNQAQIINSKRLPQVLDVRNSIYGVEFLRQNLDYRFNPRRGWSVFINVGGGTRRILRNSEIEGLRDPNDESFDFASLYDSLNLSGYQVRGHADVAYYLPVSKFTTIKFNLRSGYQNSSSTVLRNEAFRIGGNSLLRGFDEESIFSSQYHIFTLEYRLITGQNSNMFVFGDGAYIIDQTEGDERQDYPYGFGLGMNFETPVGIFGLTAAVGSQRGNPLDFQSTRIHFGYVSLF